MKNNEAEKNFFSNAHTNGATLKPATQFITKQVLSERRVPDPSSVLRSDRCPIPTYLEHRMRMGE